MKLINKKRGSMGLFVFIVIGVTFFIGYIFIRNKKATNKMLAAGKQKIHKNFPDIPGKQRFRTYIAGAHHYDQKHQPNVDNCLEIKRDLDNVYDDNAVKLLTLLGEMVGHIPADRAKMLSESLDSGRQFYAMVDKIEDSKADKSKNHYVISVHEIAKVDQTVN